MIYVLRDFHTLLPVNRWEFLKYRVKQKIVQIASKLKNNRKARLKELEKEINILEKEMENTLNFEEHLTKELQSK